MELLYVVHLKMKILSIERSASKMEEEEREKIKAQRHAEESLEMKKKANLWQKMPM